jgi:hypothetical protein
VTLEKHTDVWVSSKVLLLQILMRDVKISEVPSLNMCSVIYVCNFPGI